MLNKVKGKIVKLKNCISQACSKKVTKEPKYQLTPKGCAYLAMSQANINSEMRNFNLFWEHFCDNMKKANYNISE